MSVEEVTRASTIISQTFPFFLSKIAVGDKYIAHTLVNYFLTLAYLVPYVLEHKTIRYTLLRSPSFISYDVKVIQHNARCEQ